MRAEKLSTPEELDQDSVKALCASGGPCVSIFLPPYRGADLDRPTSIRLHNAIWLAAARLGAIAASRTGVQILLRDLRSLAENPALGRGRAKGLAVFHSPDIFQHFETPGLTEDMVVIGDRFHVLPLVTLLTRPRSFHILLLDKEQVRLLNCTDECCEETPLPRDVPKSLDEATAFKPPNHLLANRSAAGPSQGGMRAVRFGTGSDRERKHEHLREFFAAVDRGLRPLLEKEHAPLVLAGVERDTGIYRAISAYENIVPGAAAGSPAEWAQDEIVRRARSLLDAAIDTRHQKVLSALTNQAGAERMATDAASALRAASDGRVSELLVARGATVMGNFDEVVGKQPPTRHIGAREDLLNAAAVETIRHGGRVWPLPLHMIPGGSPILALLRY